MNKINEFYKITRINQIIFFKKIFLIWSNKLKFLMNYETIRSYPNISSYSRLFLWFSLKKTIFYNIKSNYFILQPINYLFIQNRSGQGSNNLSLMIVHFFSYSYLKVTFTYLKKKCILSKSQIP